QEIEFSAADRPLDVLRPAIALLDLHKLSHEAGALIVCERWDLGFITLDVALFRSLRRGDDPHGLACDAALDDAAGLFLDGEMIDFPFDAHHGFAEPQDRADDAPR